MGDMYIHTTYLIAATYKKGVKPKCLLSWMYHQYISKKVLLQGSYYSYPPWYNWYKHLSLVTYTISYVINDNHKCLDITGYQGLNIVIDYIAT